MPVLVDFDTDAGLCPSLVLIEHPPDFLWIGCLRQRQHQEDPRLLRIQVVAASIIGVSGATYE